jgi:hypothetical protein
MLSGVSLAFGEENKIAQDQPLPYICVVPVGGPWETPFYIKGLDPQIETSAGTHENVDMYLWAFDTSSTATAVEHADAVHDLMQLVFQAMQQQRPLGLLYKPVNGRWLDMNDATNRYGRAYVLTFMTDISVSDISPVDATVNEVTITESI